MKHNFLSLCLFTILSVFLSYLVIVHFSFISVHLNAISFGGFGGRIGMDGYHRLLRTTSVLIKSFVSNLSDIYSEHQIVNWCNQYKYNIFGIFDCKFQNSRPKCGRDSVWHKMHKPQTENMMKPICILLYSKRLLYIHETSYCLEVRKSPF